jgi:hypothetical protein
MEGAPPLSVLILEHESNESYPGVLISSINNNDEEILS